MITNTMSPILFDTHAFVKNLVAGGFSLQQAETLAHEQANMIENKLATKQDFELFRLATKQDIEQLRKDTKQDIEQLRKDTKQDIEGLRKDTKHDMEVLETGLRNDMHALEMRMTIKLGTMMVVLFTIFTTIIKFVN